MHANLPTNGEMPTNGETSVAAQRAGSDVDRDAVVADIKWGDPVSLDADIDGPQLDQLVMHWRGQIFTSLPSKANASSGYHRFRGDRITLGMFPCRALGILRAAWGERDNTPERMVIRRSREAIRLKRWRSNKSPEEPERRVEQRRRDDRSSKLEEASHSPPRRPMGAVASSMGTTPKGGRASKGRAGGPRASRRPLPTGGVLHLRGEAPSALLDLLDLLVVERRMQEFVDEVDDSGRELRWHNARFRLPVGDDMRVHSVLREWLNDSLEAKCANLVHSLPGAAEDAALSVSVAGGSRGDHPDDINIIWGRLAGRVRAPGGLPLHRDYCTKGVPKGVFQLAVMVLCGKTSVQTTGCVRVWPGTREVANETWPHKEQSVADRSQAPAWDSKSQKRPAERCVASVDGARVWVRIRVLTPVCAVRPRFCGRRVCQIFGGGEDTVLLIRGQSR